MRVAAIDIGTNSIHMLIVRVRSDLSFEVVDREKEMVRLGAGGLGGRRLSAESMSAGLQALSKFKRLAESHKVDKIVAAATSATREAVNGGEFLSRVARATGIRARVISGAEEARLIHMAAGYGVNVGNGRAVVIDIGGGSVEITLGTGTNVQLARSFKLGTIRLTERFVRTDPISAKDARALERHVRQDVSRHIEQILAAGFDRVIGTSGTILSVGTLAASEQRGSPPTELRNLRVTSKQIRRVRKTLTGLDLEQRLGMPGMDPRRADIIVAGALVIDMLLSMLGAEEITLCDLALREGLVLDYVRRHTREIARVDEIPDVRRRSTIELASRCNYHADHAQHVARLALALFDQSREAHGLTDHEREWLEYAALMHDIGAHISYPGHHKHSHYLITNGDLRGFQPDEVSIMALVARYHRRSTPKASHVEYARLPQRSRRIVRRLAAMLRLAENLDRSHAQVIAGLELREAREEFVLTLSASGDAELEVWAANRNLEPFADLLGKAVRVVVTQSADAVSKAS